MNWFKRSSKNKRTLFTIISYIPLIFLATSTGDEISTLHSLLFLLFFIIAIYLTVNNHKINKQENRKELSKEVESIKILYNELKSNDYSVYESLSNFKANIMIYCLKQLLNNPNFKSDDFNFDLHERIILLQEYAVNKMLSSHKGNYIALDLETTGLSTTNDRIIQLSAIKVIDFKIVDSYTTYVNPKMRIPITASRINNIYNEDVQNAPTTKEVLLTFENFIKNWPLVMHNADFDYKFLQSEYFRTFSKEFNHDNVCTMILWRNLYKEVQNAEAPSAKLSYIVYFLLKDKELKEYLNNQHDAFADAKATAIIYSRMV